MAPYIFLGFEKDFETLRFS